MNQKAKRVSIVPPNMLSENALKDILKANERLNRYRKHKSQTNLGIDTKKAVKLHKKITEMKSSRDKSRNWNLVDGDNSSINLKTEINFRPKGQYKYRNLSQIAFNPRKKYLSQLSLTPGESNTGFNHGSNPKVCQLTDLKYLI